MESKLKELTPPFECEEGETYITKLENQLKGYIEFLHKEVKDRMTDLDYEAIESISKNIPAAIKLYLKGESGGAYNKIQNELHFSLHSENEISYTLTNSKPLIRMRKSNVPFYNRKELFHIPLSQRHRVSKQRYSIDGLPCLYLAGCAYTAWLELGRPSFHDLWASAFRATREIPVLDLCYRLDCVNEIFDKEAQLSKKSKAQLLFYPFILATSYRTKYPSSPFHEEYIISNILLQWVMENKEFAGIRYMSTKVEECGKENLWMIANVVLPPKGNNDGADYDQYLCQNLEMTTPQQCFTLEAYSNAGTVTASETKGGMSEFSEKGEKHLEYMDIEILNNYNATRFYNIDGYLREYLKYSLITQRP